MKLNEQQINKHLGDQIFSLLSQVLDDLHIEGYVIGGYVRDIFLKRPSKDIDVVVVGSGIKVAKALIKKIGAPDTSLAVYQTFGTAQVKWGSIEVEFVGARRESYQRDSRKPIVEDGSLEDDQNRRDFTINALAICLNKERFGEVVDPFDGMEDMRNMTIRTPLDPDITFSDDPLRMMRAVRFAAQLRFEIEPSTFESIRQNRERISIISAERIADELNKIILSPKPSEGFYLLDACGLLDLIFPELAALKGVDVKRGVGHKDNFNHTLQVLDNLSQQTGNLWLRWSALLHDIAKPATKRWEEGAGWTFHNHNFIGEKMIPAIFRRMKLPMNEKMKYVQKMVSLHMRPIVLAEDIVTDSAVRRLLFDAGDDIDDLMMLCDADITSRNSEKVRRFRNNFQLVRQKLKEIEEKDRLRNFQPPVTGEEIMETFGLSPCKEVGQIKSHIKDAILDGVIPNEPEEARVLMFKMAEKMGLKAVK